MTITQERAAELLGITRQSVGQRVRRGTLVLTLEGLLEAARQRGDAEAEARIEAEARASSPAPSAAKPPRSAGKNWREVLEREKALKARLERWTLQGTLVSRPAAEAAASARGALVRDRLLNIAPRLGPALAAESDARRCIDMVDAEIRRTLEELTREAAE